MLMCKCVVNGVGMQEESMLVVNVMSIVLDNEVFQVICELFGIL